MFACYVPEIPTTYADIPLMGSYLSTIISLYIKCLRVIIYRRYRESRPHLPTHTYILYLHTYLPTYLPTYIHTILVVVVVVVVGSLEFDC